MDRGLLWRSALVQAGAVALVFALLVALPLPSDFFEDYGAVSGPVAWVLCSLVTARVLGLSAGRTALAALAGGAAGGIVGVALNHAAGLVIGVAVFAAACATY